MPDLIRELPYNAEAEQWVIGSILIDNSLFYDISKIIKPEDFYINDNKLVFGAMFQLTLENKNIDAATITSALSGVKDGSNEVDYDDISSYLYQVVSSIPQTYDAIDYAHIIKQKSTLRKLILASDEIKETVYSNQNDSQIALDHAEQLIYDIGLGNESRDFITLANAFTQSFDVIDKLKNPAERDAYLGQRTGMTEIDKTIVGMGEGDLIILGARPGMGKTALAMNIAINVAKQKKTVCIFSLEMSALQIANRIIQSEALIDSYKLRSGTVDADELEKIVKTTTRLSECDVRIDDTSGITVAQMKSKIRRLGKKVDLIIIDYLQLLKSDRKTDNRVQEVSEITRNLKLMAKDLQVPIICCAQLSRASVQNKTSKKPGLADLRESGSIEQDADIIMLLYSDEYFDPDAPKPDQYDVECIVAKNRHGETRSVKLRWLGKFTKFISYDKTHEPPTTGSPKE